MADEHKPGRDEEGQGPEHDRRVRGKPGTEAAKEMAREKQRLDRGGKRSDMSPDPEGQTDESGTEKKLNEPFREGG